MFKPLSELPDRRWAIILVLYNNGAIIKGGYCFKELLVGGPAYYCVNMGIKIVPVAWSYLPKYVQEKFNFVDGHSPIRDQCHENSNNVTNTHVVTVTNNHIPGSNLP